MAQTFLIIGGAGRLGQELIRAAKADSRDPTPKVFALDKTIESLPYTLAELCESVTVGDALEEEVISQALKESGADTVIVAIGTGDNVDPGTTRQANAQALVNVIKPGTEFEKVRVVCVSSVGSGGTKINVGLGVGMGIAYFLRHVLKDHDAQEDILKKGLEEDRKRLLIVRPSGLTSGNPKGGCVLFDERGPTSEIDRADVAQWIIDEACGEGAHFGTDVNITAPKK